MADLEEANSLLEKVDSTGNIERVGMIPASLYAWAYVYGGGWFDEKTNKITAERAEERRRLADDWRLSQAPGQ